MSLTTDPGHPDLGRSADTGPGPQDKAYLVLSDEERAKGFTRPLRRSYRHVGTAGPRFPLADLTEHQREVYGAEKYAKYEEYPPAEHPSLGRFWTQADLDHVGQGCGTVTTMAQAIAETYARSPAFYGATYCCGCRMHLPVGTRGEFTWVEEDGSEYGYRVGE